MNHFIRIGEIGFGCGTECLRTFVGSCVAVVLHDRANGAAALAHVQLPSSLDTSSRDPGRYADTAIPEMMRRLQQQSRLASSLEAHIAGGADMFAVSQARSVGYLNANAIRLLLASQRIPILTEDCGGTSARRLLFDIHAGTLKIEPIEPPPVITRALRVKP